MFTEYAASLETLGAWAWSIQNRFEYGCFLNARLSYEVSHVSGFYRSLDEHEGGLVELLRLPPAQIMIDAAAARQIEPQPLAEYHATLANSYGHLEQAAGLYLQDARVIPETFNKTKHGLPMLRDEDDPDRFHVLVREPTGEPRPWRMAWFDSSDAEIEKFVSSVQAAATWVRELAALLRILREAHLLYIPLL